MKTEIIPQIKEIEQKTGNVSIADYTLTKEYISVVPVSEELVEEAGGGKGIRPISLTLDAVYAEEEYRISVTLENISVTASTPRGAYYALCTISQLAIINKGRLECCEIHDWPGLKVRGFSDDISRGQISTLDNFKSIVKRLSRYKCNLYQPYIEDSLAFGCLPESGKFSDPVGTEEWLELINYADRYYVDIIPIINLFGHWDKNSVLEAFSDYMMREGGKPDGKPLPILDIRKTEVLEIIGKILDEVTAIFGGKGLIHVGGDEVMELTSLFSKDESAEIYNGYYKYINEELKKRGCKMMMYSDMYTPVWGNYQLRLDDINEMPDDITFVYWDYTVSSDYKNIEELIRRGKRFYISPATHSWNRFLPDIYLPWQNTKKMAKLAPEHYEGIIMSAWCDGGINLREENWFGILTGAYFGWDPKTEMPLDGFIKSFYEIYYGLENVDVNAVYGLFGFHRFFAPENHNEAELPEPLGLWYDELHGLGTRLYNEFWKDARKPADEKCKLWLDEMLEQVLAAQAYFEAQKSVWNSISYETMLFDIKRFIVNLKKLKLMKTGAYRSREEAMVDIPVITALADEISALRNDNKRLWFSVNRKSEWEFCESKFIDVEESLRSLARYCKVAKILQNEKIL